MTPQQYDQLEDVIHCGDERLTITSSPPLATERGAAWWLRLDDVWIRLWRRPPGEEMTPHVLAELCRLTVAPRSKFA